jgi:hypothetical protein
MLVSLDAVKAVEHMKPVGYMDAILGSGVVRFEPGVGEVIEIRDSTYWEMVVRYSPESFNERIALHLCGPGCQLKKSIAWFGIKDDGSCGCDSFAAKMDAWGPDETIRRIEEVVEHLREAANKRGFPFIATAARVMIGRAVEAARLELAKSPAFPK